MANSYDLFLTARGIPLSSEYRCGSCRAGLRDPRAGAAVRSLMQELKARVHAAVAPEPEPDELEMLGPDAPVPSEDRFPTDKGPHGAGARSPLFWKTLLVFAALVWGSSTFIMKDTLTVLPTFLLLACRFIPAALMMLVMFNKRIRIHFNKRNIVVGVVMGIIMWAAYGLQTIGLNETTAGKSAFLTGTYCILVPFFSYFLARERITKFNVGAALLCLGGIALVALDNFSMGMGDALTLASACFFALQMSMVSKYGRNLDVNVITFWMFLSMGILSGGTSLLTENHPPLSAFTPNVLGVLVYLSVLCTCGCLLIQNVALSHVPPATGSLLLSLESPSGVMFSVMFAGEVVTGRLLAGFALIFISIVLSETHFSFLKKLLPATAPRSSEAPEADAA
ncbi:MAG: DMT family transporter [Coriobacteriaceae bacterium]|nr:DMT family transporter [Coriobacteriaceae bacterium]